MNVNMSSVVEGLTNLVLAIGADENLASWFRGLAGKSIAERRLAIYSMSDRLENLSSASLITAFRSLAVPSIFDAAHLALENAKRS